VRCRTLTIFLFFKRGYAEIHIQRPFFDNKKAYKKKCIENPNDEHMLYRIFFGKILKSQFLVVFQNSSS
jgi:hypothetical protein